MQIIKSPHVTAPAGHYSHAVISGHNIYISGQLPFALNSTTLPVGAAAQTIQVLQNIESILRSCNASLSHLISVQVMVSDITLWPEVNQAYSQYLGSYKPARTIIPCGELHYGALVEINAIAEFPGHENA